jgi:integrase
MPLHEEIGPVKVYAPVKPDGVWQVTWTAPGMLRQVKQRKTKKKAIALAKEVRGQLKRGEIGKVHRITAKEAEWIRLCRKLDDPKRVLEEAVARQEAFGRRISISEACERYRQEYIDSHHRRATVQDAKSRSKIIEDSLGERYLDSLSEGDVEKWRSALNGSNRHINNTHRHLRHLFERARVWGLVPRGFNPAKDVALLREPRKEPSVWTPEDLRKCFQWYRDGNCPGESAHRICFLALGAFAGLRPSEIEGVFGDRPGLRWEDIDFKARHIHVRPEVAGKLSEPRYITFTAKPESGLSKKLADQMWKTLKTCLLPLRKAGGEITGRRTQRDMSSELRTAGVIEHWPKDGLRHTWISSLLALGVHRDWVAELAGNSPAIIRTNYKRPMPEKVAEEWFSTHAGS